MTAIRWTSTGSAVSRGFESLALTLLKRDAAPASSAWYLMWADEFDGPDVDETKWRIENAALVKNNELQYYAPDEVYIEDGHLVLRSRKRSMGRRDYTSGLVETKDKFEFLYGRVEIRAQLPRTQGLWLAHWMLPADGSWPPEIDIMESVGSQPNWIVMSVHNGRWPKLDSQSQEHLGPDYSVGFHTFTLEWDPDELRWYIDGTLQFATREGVPQKPFYLIMITAVGGVCRIIKKPNGRRRLNFFAQRLHLRVPPDTIIESMQPTGHLKSDRDLPNGLLVDLYRKFFDLRCFS